MDAFSGPMRIATPSRASLAVSVAKYPIKQSDFSSSFMRASTYCFLFIYYSYLKLVTKMSNERRFDICTLYRLEKMSDLPLNQLYLFSKADNVIDYKQVEQFAGLQQKRPNSRIEIQCWEDSPHVQHLLNWPKQYTQLCSNFANRLFTRPIIDKAKI